MITLPKSNAEKDVLTHLSAEKTALEIKNLDLYYGDKQALHDVSMKIKWHTLRVLLLLHLDFENLHRKYESQDA